jgi:hypothetical protein
MNVFHSNFSDQGVSGFGIVRVVRLENAAPATGTPPADKDKSFAATDVFALSGQPSHWCYRIAE